MASIVSNCKWEICLRCDELFDLYGHPLNATATVTDYNLQRIRKITGYNLQIYANTILTPMKKPHLEIKRIN